MWFDESHLNPTWMRHVIHADVYHDSCFLHPVTYESHMNKSWHTCECVPWFRCSTSSHIWIPHEWVMAHMWMCAMIHMWLCAMIYMFYVKKSKILMGTMINYLKLMIQWMNPRLVCGCGMAVESTYAYTCKYMYV